MPARTQTVVTTARREDAFALAALHLQHDLAAGAPPETGFLNRYTDWWLARTDQRPAWIAKTPTGDPVGALTGLVVDDRPAVGRRPRPWLHLTFLFVAPAHRTGGVAFDLVARCQEWAGARGIERIAVHDPGQGQGVFDRRGFVRSAETLVWRPPGS